MEAVCLTGKSLLVNAIVTESFARWGATPEN